MLRLRFATAIRWSQGCLSEALGLRQGQSVKSASLRGRLIRQISSGLAVETGRLANLAALLNVLLQSTLQGCFSYCSLLFLIRFFLAHLKEFLRHERCSSLVFLFFWCRGHLPLLLFFLLSINLLDRHGSGIRKYFLCPCEHVISVYVDEVITEQVKVVIVVAVIDILLRNVDLRPE